MIFLLLYSYNEKEWRGRMIIMHMTSIGKKTWCQRVRAAIILEGAILLVAAFILWKNTAGAGENAVAATSDGTIRWVDFNVSYEALCKAYEYDVGTKRYILTGSTCFPMWRLKMAGSLVHPQCRN